MINCNTKHFTFNEFTNTSYKEFANENKERALKFQSNIFNMMCVLEYIRHLYNMPIKVTSGFRCPALNKKVGGVVNSNHMIGRAVDICPRVPSNSSVFEKYMRFLVNACDEAKNIGLLSYVEYHSNYIHIQLPN